MKRILALFLVLLMTLAIVACNNSNDDTSTDTNTDLSTDEAPKEDLSKYTMSKYLTLPSYKDLELIFELDSLQAQIDKEILNQTINSAREYRVQKGDSIYVNVIFDVFENGEWTEIPELTKEDYLIESVGDGSYLLELENLLIDRKISPEGSSYFNTGITLPDDFYAEEWRGRDVRAFAKVVSKQCKLGDIVKVDYTGYYLDKETLETIKDENGNDKIFDSANDAKFFLGSHLAIDDFENALVNARVNKKISFNATFPQDYSVEELKGQTIKFEAIVTKLYVPLAYNDEFAREYLEASTTAEYEEQIKKEWLEAEALNNIIENSKVIKYPKSEYDKLQQKLEETAKSFEDQYGTSFDEYLQDELNMTRDEYIKATLKLQMSYYAVAQAEGISPTSNQLQDERDELIAYYYDYYINKGYAKSEAEKTATELVNELGELYIYEQVVNELVTERLCSYAKVTYLDKTYTSISEINK